MNDELRRMIDQLDDAGVMRLAVAVQQQLGDESSDAAFARLSPEQASEFLAKVARLLAKLDQASDLPASAAVAREFLDLVLSFDVFDELVTASALDTGVRVGFGDILSWFQGSFNLASLVGLSFEYVSEKKVVQQTETGTVETSRTIRIGLGTKD